MASATKTKRGGQFRLTPLAVGIGLALGIGQLRVVTAADNPGDPIGAEFQVNNTATNSQATPAVAMDADGDFVVVWQGDGEIGKDSFGAPIIVTGICARCYSNTGLPVSTEFPIDASSTAGSPSVAMDANGDFVVAWEDVELADVYFRRYNEGCEARDSERVQANSTSNGGPPSVAMDADGDFVVAWDESGYDIYARRYNNLGQAQDNPEFVANTSSSTPARDPSVAMDADGDFVMAWESYYGARISARRYNKLGEAQDESELIVNTSSDTTSNPSVAMVANGDFVVAWERGSSNFDAIFARLYSADGTPQADEFQVNTSGTSGQLAPSVALDADGDFVIAWENYYQEIYDISAQRYSADGTRQGGEFLVNSNTADNKLTPSVALDADGDFVIAWDSYLQDGDISGIYAQRFTGPENVDLSIVVTDDLDPVEPGGLLNYAFIVTNNHPIVTPTGVPAIDGAIGMSTGINTSHTLPEGVSLDAFSGNDWTCTQTARTAGQVDCTFSGTLLPTAATSADLTLSFETTVPAAADITTDVNVTGDQFDADLTNSTDSEPTSVVSPDTQPDPFSFDARTNVAPGTLVNSNPITVSGIDTPVPISLLGVSGASYSIDGGPFTIEAGTVANGSTVIVQQTSWSDFSTTTNATLVIGGVTGTFSVSTASSLDSVTDEPEPVSVISNEDPSSPAAAADPAITPGSSGGGCSLAGNRSAAGGLGWMEAFGLLLLALFRRRKC